MAVTTHYPTAHSDTYVKATGQLNMDCAPYYATDPALSLIGFAQPTVSWISSYSDVTNQKFNVDLGSAQIINTLAINNYHEEGLYTSNGIENFSLYGTNNATAFSNTTYANVDDLVLLGTAQAVAHSASDAEDTQIITFSNSNAYRYYVLRISDNLGSGDYMGIRHIEFQYDDTLNVPEMSGGAVVGGSTSIKLSLVSTAGAVGGGSFLLTKHDIKLTSGGAVAGKELTGGAVAGGEAFTKRLQSFFGLSGILDFDGEIEALQWLNNITGELVFEGSVNAFVESSLSLTGVLDFDGSIDVNYPETLSLIGILDFDGSIDIAQDNRMSFIGLLDFDGSIDIETQNLISIEGILDFNGVIDFQTDGSNQYSLDLHNSLRWT